MTTTQDILVIGATGKTGRRVVDRLRSRGRSVRAGSRSGTPPFDWNDQSTWEPVLRGVDAAYVAFHPDLAIPGTSVTIGAFTKLAVDAGVRRLVLLSGRGEAEALRCEQVVRDCGTEWAIVRASWFNQNFDEGWLLDSVLHGVIALPAGDLAEPFIDVEDVADVATAALTEDRHAGKVYEVSGPRLLTFAEVAAEISAASGHDVRYQPVTPERYRELMAEHGVPEADIGMFLGLFAEILDGRNAYLSDGVQRALGRAPRDFSDYVRATAATGVWRAS